MENAVLTADYRHLLESGRFDLGGSITYATEAGSDSDPNPSGQAFRGNLEGEGDFHLGNYWGWGYDLAVASDDTYLDRYNFSDDNVLQNRLFTERIWSRNYAVIQGYGFQGLREDDDQGTIPIAVPLAELELTSQPMLWDSRVAPQQQRPGPDPDRGPGHPAPVDAGGVGAAQAGPDRRSVSPDPERARRRLQHRRRPRDLQRRRRRRQCRPLRAARHPGLELAVAGRWLRRQPHDRADRQRHLDDHGQQSLPHSQRGQPGRRVRRHQPVQAVALSRHRPGRGRRQDQLWRALRPVRRESRDGERPVRPALQVQRRPRHRGRIGLRAEAASRTMSGASTSSPPTG